MYISPQANRGSTMKVPIRARTMLAIIYDFHFGNNCYRNIFKIGNRGMSTVLIVVSICTTLNPQVQKAKEVPMISRQVTITIDSKPIREISMSLSLSTYFHQINHGTMAIIRSNHQLKENKTCSIQ